MTEVKCSCRSSSGFDPLPGILSCSSMHILYPDLNFLCTFSDPLSFEGFCRHLCLLLLRQYHVAPPCVEGHTPHFYSHLPFQVSVLGVPTNQQKTQPVNHVVTRRCDEGIHVHPKELLTRVKVVPVSIFQFYVSNTTSLLQEGADLLYVCPTLCEI